MRWLVWWVAIAAIYLLESATPGWGEAGIAIVVACAGTLVAALAIRNGRPGVRVPWARVAQLAPVPLAMLRDVFRVTRRILESYGGRTSLVGLITRQPYDVGAPGDETAVGSEAMAILRVCLAPNTVVLDVDERGELVVHELEAPA
jgi:multisubunit Na+/H+ antiporter MnhE subunit